MLEQKRVEVGGKEYKIEQLPTSKGIEVGIQIAHIVGGASDGFMFTTSNVLDSAINPAKIISGILDRMDSKTTPAFIKQLVLDSVKEPKLDGDAYEALFSGRPEDLYELLEAIIDHNRYVDLIKKKVIDAMQEFFPIATTDTGRTPST